MDSDIKSKVQRRILGVLLQVYFITARGLIPGSSPMFDGKGYDDWCVKMEAIFSFQEIDEIAKVGFKELFKNADEVAEKVSKEKKKLNCKARYCYTNMLLPTFSKKFQRLSQQRKTVIFWRIGMEILGKLRN